MPRTKESGRSEIAKLASRIYRQVDKPDGLDAEGLARGYLALERERDALVLVAEAVVNGEWEAARELADAALKRRS